MCILYIKHLTNLQLEQQFVVQFFFLTKTGLPLVIGNDVDVFRILLVKWFECNFAGCFSKQFFPSSDKIAVNMISCKANKMRV